MSKEAIRLALGTLEAIANHGDIAAIATPDGVIFLETAITALREALAEQPAQQEPVARLQVFMESFDMGQSLAPNTEYKFASASACQAAKMLPLGNYDLYTSPQAQPAQRTWVGLTDEQIDAIWDAVITPSNHIREFVRAIEAAHGIKGDA